MPRIKNRWPVRVLPAHIKEYEKIIKEEGCDNLAEAIRQVQARFNMPQPHTRQAVILHLPQKLIQLMAERRGQSPVKRISKRRGRPPKTMATPQLDYEKAIDTMLVAFERAKEYPILKAELEKYKRGYENIMEAAKIREESDKRQQDQAQRFRLAQQQGDITPSNFTEHLLTNPSESIAKTAPLLNISEGLFYFR